MSTIDQERVALMDVLRSVSGRLKRGKRVVRNLPGGGRLMIDRPLPFICLYRSGPDNADPGVDALVRAQASYLRFPDDREAIPQLRNVLAAVAGAITSTSKAFLIIELWPADRARNPDTFRAFCPANNMPSTAQVLKKYLTEMARSLSGVHIEVVDTPHRHPPHLERSFTVDELKKLGILTIGVEIPPVYLTAAGTLGPLALRGVRDLFTEAIKHTVLDFIHVQTPLHFPHHLTLGRTNISQLAVHIDRRLAAIAGSFETLLDVSPVNTDQAWHEFEHRKYEHPPNLSYRLIQVDPDLAKRQLFQLRITEVEDGALQFIFHDKRSELETQLTLLSERGTPEFLFSSLRLHGAVEPELLHKARSLIAHIDRLPQRERGDRLHAKAFAALVEKELERYRDLFPGRELGVRVRDDVDGVLVSKGRVLISENFQVAAERARALINHEVGTHVLTYCNGRRQPLRQLYTGLAGYDQLQEGLAVLAEYMSAGLNPRRLRLLATRVVAVDAMVKGATFIDCFRLLTKDHGYAAATAFRIAARVYRGGGFAKDATYLRGIDFLIGHLHRTPRELDLFYLGKFGTRHIHLIEDLFHRGILKKAVLPLFLDDAARARIASFKTITRLEHLLQ